MNKDNDENLNAQHQPEEKNLGILREVNIATINEGADEMPAPTYPAAENERIGVRTNKAADPKLMDQGDEEAEGKLYNTPDDVTPGFGNETNDIFIPGQNVA